MPQKSLKSQVQKIKNIFWHYPKNYLTSSFYQFPSKKLIIIGVTGTDGKTTTCHLIHHILINAGIKAGLISTTGAKIGDSEFPTKLHMTSPDPVLVQQLLKKMVDEKVTHVVLEVTAHALDQYRFLGCEFEVSVITNTSHEHLDYFRNMETYIDTKAKLFNHSKNIILNKDDQSFEQIKNQINKKFISYSIDSKSDFQARQIELSSESLKFNVNGLNVITDSNYYYQVYNILAALAVTKTLNISPQILIDTVKNYPETSGRRQEITNNFKFRTIVDFAHTPAALDSTLTSLKKNTRGNLIVIFGATGGRDQSKRPIMGKVVSEIADIAIITADDTRNEKIEDINQQIIVGISPKNSILLDHQSVNTYQHLSKIIKNSKNKFYYYNIPNRQDAFNLAVKIAKPGDLIIACGKGHETTILHGSTEYPWSESEAFRTAFRFKDVK
jgi:UDP-N-acetylmuramoyl-L-alanyl-D-glutamate--2,6-diaminopimelate ligase